MKAVLLVSLAASLWGTVGVANRLMTGTPPLDPTLAGLSRTGLGALCLLALASILVTVRPAWRSLPVGRLLAFGLAGAVFQVCLFAAFDVVGVTITVAVTVAGPAALVSIGDAAWNRRLPAPAATIAVAVATAGLLVALTDRPDGGQVAIGWRGIALLLLATSAFAIVAACARSLGAILHPLHAAGLGLLFTTGTLAVLAVAAGVDPGHLAALGARDVGILAYTGVAATGGAYLAFVTGMSLSRSPTTGIAATLIEPGIAALLAAVVLDERLTPQQANGCALMLGSIVLLAGAEGRAARGGRPDRDEGNVAP
ncbi:MAG TPA: DMT family transporter [Amaricoccus sp.]|nr:DMT family transporter [Amaricoccus sp.]